MATYTKVYNNPYPDGWKDGKDGNTPVTADILNNQTETLESIEQYLEDNPIEQGGSGTGGTTDYADLNNKPTINGVEVVGDLSLEDLGITGGGGSGTTNYNDLTNKPSINGTELSGDITLDIPTKTSDLENDSGFLTEIPEQSYNDLADKPKINGIDLQGNLTVEELGLLDITESTDTTLENSKDGVLKIKEIYGNTIQDGEPTPDVPVEPKNVVLSEIKTCGKILLKKQHDYLTSSYSVEDNKINLSTGANGNPNGFYFANVLKKGVKCVISGIATTNITNIRIYRESNFGNWLQEIAFNTTSGNFSIEYTPTYDDEVIRFWIPYGTTCTITDFKITYASGEFETYTESVATLSEPITLNGIGGVRDNLDRKKFAEIVFDGSDDEGWRVSGSVSGRYYVKDELRWAKEIKMLCTHAKYLFNTSDINTFFADDYSQFIINTSFGSLAEWKSHLASNPMTVVYELAEPIETPLPEADVEALKSLKTYDGVTHIFTDSEIEPDWLVEYNTTRVGTELDEIDAELAKINKRITDISTTAQMNYSTEEQVVGTWIDGKPLYQKTLFYQNYALSSGYNELPIGTNNVDVVVDTKAYVSNSTHTNYRPMNSYTLEDDDNSIYYIVNVESNVLYLVTKTSWSTPNIHFTIQYTKTTDTV